ncbi:MULTISPECIES: 5'-nucleotidase [Thiorhodovibrio]|uniref:5'-nucleotidase n=1 Tax=Thiorhodovibrio TaxID=61593 RepID=UPI0019143833|nr:MULTISPECIES: 5'-nucleotidase [Thiorhodovibrio]MBK5971243.1 5'-nucleotidase [Thiorhodovibrio winogradskyi]WPL14610.1 5'-nucleotidase [Thiorhodovibrio litoralis]
MSEPQSDIRLVVAISSRALFDLAESHRVFEDQGIGAYHEYQVAHESDVLEEGVAFPLVKKLLALNERLGDRGQIDVILLSRNSTDTGLRVFNSIHHYGLEIARAAFTSGASPYRYVSAFGAHLFLSADPSDVRRALMAGCAAATIWATPPFAAVREDDEQLRIAFDGDAVLFSDESERIFRRDGLAAFNANEVAAAREPLSDGPFKGFLLALQRIQSIFPATESPLRTALITARGAPSHERVIRTLRAWDIRIDEALFLSGLSKGRFLKAFDADIFFDDQETHCQDASTLVATGHVPLGVANPPDSA